MTPALWLIASALVIGILHKPIARTICWLGDKLNYDRKQYREF